MVSLDYTGVKPFFFDFPKTLFVGEKGGDGGSGFLLSTIYPR